jgi:hypothetical protein
VYFYFLVCNSLEGIRLPLFLPCFDLNFSVLNDDNVDADRKYQQMLEERKRKEEEERQLAQQKIEVFTKECEWLERAIFERIHVRH